MHVCNFLGIVLNIDEFIITKIHLFMMDIDVNISLFLNYDDTDHYSLYTFS